MNILTFAATILIILLRSFYSFKIFSLRGRFTLHRKDISISNKYTESKDRRHFLDATDAIESLPRLSEDIDALLWWVEYENGFVKAKINKTTEGWTLVSINGVTPGETLISIPKKLCIFSNPEDEAAVKMPLLNTTIKLMSTLDKKQWRVRLALALLSERVRPNSFYRAYLRNLPFEFWGVPMFFNSTVFTMIQDYPMMQKTRERCKFLLEYTENVLLPLHKTSLDPFLGQNADVNAFGWAFASAASRAIRSPNVLLNGTMNPVLIPIIDIASHHDIPNCEIIDCGNRYELKTLKTIKKDEEITIDYGPMTNDERFADYGFTTDNDLYDTVSVAFDTQILESARIVMGQCLSQSNTNNNNIKPSEIENIIKNDARIAKIGRGADRLDPLWLHGWQIIWLRAIGLFGPVLPESSITMILRSPQSKEFIDPRLWACLRVLYAEEEADLVRYGYDPFTLQAMGSLVSSDIEVHVLRTLIGLVAICLRIFTSDVASDIEMLKTGRIVSDMEDKLLVDRSTPEDIVSDVYRLIKIALDPKLYLYNHNHHNKLISTNSIISNNNNNNNNMSRKLNKYNHNYNSISNTVSSIATSSSTVEEISTNIEDSHTSDVKNKNRFEEDNGITTSTSTSTTAISPKEIINDFLDVEKHNNLLTDLSVEDIIRNEQGSIHKSLSTASSSMNTAISSSYDKNDIRKKKSGVPEESNLIHNNDNNNNNNNDNNHHEEEIQHSNTNQCLLDEIAVTDINVLPVNVREALKYRIRKKQLLNSIIVKLNECFEVRGF